MEKKNYCVPNTKVVPVKMGTLLNQSMTINSTQKVTNDNAVFSRQSSWSGDEGE